VYINTQFVLCKERRRKFYNSFERKTKKLKNEAKRKGKKRKRMRTGHGMKK